MIVRKRYLDIFKVYLQMKHFSLIAVLQVKRYINYYVF
jgi:hypothetical protein